MRHNMSLVMRKLAFCICENKDANHLCGNREADQRLCFRFIDGTIPLLPIYNFQASDHLLWLCSPVCVGPGRKSRRPVFSQRVSYDASTFYYLSSEKQKSTAQLIIAFAFAFKKAIIAGFLLSWLKCQQIAAKMLIRMLI